MEMRSTVEIKSGEGEGEAGVEVGSFHGDDVVESQMSFPISVSVSVSFLWGCV